MTRLFGGQKSLQRKASYTRTAQIHIQSILGLGLAEGFAWSTAGPVKSTDPGLAAAVRAQHRKEIDSLKGKLSNARTCADCGAIFSQQCIFLFSDFLTAMWVSYQMRKCVPIVVQFSHSNAFSRFQIS